MFHRVIVILLSLSLGSLADNTKWNMFNNPNYVPGRDVMVHLFEWKWNDIADECERFLGPKGFAGVQTSPVTENMIIGSRSWSERYQPISYRWITRSGNEEEFGNMVRRCNNVGVRIYVDLILNHMTMDKQQAVGTGGTTADTFARKYLAIPYRKVHFHSPCEIKNWTDVRQLRNCQVIGHDLDQAKRPVRDQMIFLMNKLIAAGVAGFRIDSAKYMWPNDLAQIYAGLNYLNTDHGFLEYARPYIYQEVADFSASGDFKNEYIRYGAVTEYVYGSIISESLKKETSNETHILIPSEDALVFIDTHETQRWLPFDPLSHKSPKLYKMAIAFMLAHSYGNPRIMSSYAFEDPEAGPPADEYFNIISPKITNNGSCEGGWICEHRWPQIFNMVAFRNTVRGTTANDNWDNRNNKYAFSRGNRGFIAINADDTNLFASIPTKLPPGIYCDVISGNLIDGTCSGKSVVVNMGHVGIAIHHNDEEGVIAIHSDAKLPQV